jgi:hypothetical protein
MEILYNEEFVHGLSWALSAIFWGRALCQFYITLHHIPEDCNRNDHCCENLDSQRMLKNIKE